MSSHQSLPTDDVLFPDNGDIRKSDKASPSGMSVALSGQGQTSGQPYTLLLSEYVRALHNREAEDMMVAKAIWDPATTEEPNTNLSCKMFNFAVELLGADRRRSTYVDSGAIQSARSDESVKVMMTNNLCTLKDLADGFHTRQTAQTQGEFAIAVKDYEHWCVTFPKSNPDNFNCLPGQGLSAAFTGTWDHMVLPWNHDEEASSIVPFSFDKVDEAH